MLNRTILCIDLKCFYASCECIRKQVNPFTYPLVVANKNQGNGAMTLAISPFLKSLGLKSRGRLYEIPKNLKYEVVTPHMELYIRKSMEVISIYLDFVSKEDLHIYSIDECFLDLTSYLKLYQKNDKLIAKEILETIKNKTGLTATAGIGPNMFLAKAAMDIEAKKSKFNIAKWHYKDVPNKLWKINDLTSVWGIGTKYEKRLQNIGIKSIYDLAHTNPYYLKDKFGIIGYELWNHANGIDNAIICKPNYIFKRYSYSNSQTLLKDYNEHNIKLLIIEMVDVLTKRLRRNKKKCSSVSLSINYSKDIGGGFSHMLNLESPTNYNKEIVKLCNFLFEKYYTGMPIRKIRISLGNIINDYGTQLNLFKNSVINEYDYKLNLAIDKIQNKYGKNSILRASALLDYSNIINQNKKIGGHYA